MSYSREPITRHWNRNNSVPGALVAFPISRHGRDGVSFVEAVATRMLDLPPGAAERHLARQLDRKGQTLRRRGFDAATIKSERDKAEAAIRALLLRSEFEGDAR
jgi:hypothetical protein